MFDVGFSELVLLFVIGLLVLGPQRLPKVAAELGKWVSRARRTATQLRRQLEREIELSEVIQPPKPPASHEPPPPAAPEQPTPEPPVAEPQSATAAEDSPAPAGAEAAPVSSPSRESADKSPNV